MLKFITIILNALLLLFYQLFFTNEVTVDINLPAEVQVNTEFTVELTVNKSNISSYASLKQKLPEGFTAVGVETKGASFTFNNQTAKFIWMALPSDESFTVKYKVKVDQSAKGEHILGGQFSWVDNNVKNVAKIPPTSIKVIDGTETEPVVADVPVEELDTKMPEEVEVMCVRNAPNIISASDEFVVEILIKKGTTSGFAKLTDILPEGFVATAIESAGASFKFENQQVKFIWMSVPSQQEFKVSYNVKITNQGMNGEKSFEGVYSYVNEDNRETYFIHPFYINVEPSELMADSNEEELGDNIGLAEGTSDEMNETVVSTMKPDETLSNDATATYVPSNNNASIQYKVQVLALRNAKNSDVVANYFGLNQDIATEMGGGFTKYVVGSHYEYKAARDNRESLKNNDKIIGPFVTAYNSGQRITVQEALMISNQQWYR